MLLLFYAEFAGLFAFLLWKCRYGFGDADESFWLTVSWRFLHGDRMILQEWHLSQFGFFTMIPEMWLYLRIVGTTEGMILIFRYAYTVCWCAGCLFMYFRARNLHEYGARCAALFLMCYAPYGIMAFSYNSLCILYLINAMVFFLCAKRYQKVQCVVSGFFFAGAVLCCPYLAGIYLIYTAILGVARLRKKDPEIPTNEAKATICWKYFTIGVGSLAILFLISVFWGTDPVQVLESLGHALRDAEHANFSLANKTGEYFRQIANSNAWFYPMLVVFLLMTALTMKQRKAIWFCVVCAAETLYFWRFLKGYGYINYLMFPLTFVGIYVMIATRNRKIRCVAWLWLIPGILYTYCLNYSSNQQFLYAISSAAAVSSASSLILMWMYCDELKVQYLQQGKGKGFYLFAYAALLICFVAQMRYEVPVRYQSVYWEPELMVRGERQLIEEGPEKGIIATAEKAEHYKELYNDIKLVKHQKLLILSEEIWMYLANENEMSTYSGWLWRVNDYAMGRLHEYYETQPQKKPEIVFLEDGFEAMLKYFNPEDYEIEQLESGNYFIRPIITRK